MLSIGLVLRVGFLLMVPLAASAALAAWGRWWAPVFGNEQLLLWVNHGLGFVLTALLFKLGKALIGWYIGSSGVASGFGAASAIVALLVWVHGSAQVFLFGAEVTWIFAQRHGSRRDPCA